MKIAEEERRVCDCKRCKNACTVKPGLFTYEQIQQVADYLNIDVKTLFEKYLGIEYLSLDGINAFALAPAVTKMKPGTFYPLMNGGTCVFLDATEHCKIHPVAPLECQLYHHSDSRARTLHVRRTVLRTWRKKKHFIEQLHPFEKLDEFQKITLHLMDMDKKELAKMTEGIKSGNINAEQALEWLDELGYAPNLVNDDAGRWAVSSDGFQAAPEEKPIDMNLVVMVEADQWKKSITEAVVHYLESLEDRD